MLRRLPLDLGTPALLEILDQVGGGGAAFSLKGSLKGSLEGSLKDSLKGSLKGSIRVESTLGFRV